MVQPSKKQIRKVSKGKDKASPAPSPVKPVEQEDIEVEDQEESDWSEEDEDEDEDNGGVSEKGMKRLMELVGEEDLDEFEIGMLGGSDEDEGDSEEDDEEEDDEDEDLEMDDESASDDGDEDEDLDDSVLMDTADPDAVRLDDLDSNASLDEDAVPMRKVTANNKPAMRILIEALKVTHLPWPETLVLQSKDKVDCDPSDDLKREMAFYKVALDQVAVGRKMAAKNDIPFTRPNDYYAEMVKSDEHMERIRTKLVDEAQGIKKSEAAKKQRDLKKYGKQIQVQKLKEREMDKKAFQDRVQGVKRKRKEGAELGDEFNIDVDDAMEDRPERGGGSRGRGGKTKMPRSARDNKYSLGGGGRRSKENTKESTTDFAAWGGGGGGGRGGSRGGRGGSGGRGGGGGRGGSSGGRGGASGGRGGAGAGGSRPTQRPGKSRRK